MLYHATARIDQELQSKTAEASVVPRGTTTQTYRYGVLISVALLWMSKLKKLPRSRIEVRPAAIPSLLMLTPTLTLDLELTLWHLLSIPGELWPWPIHMEGQRSLGSKASVETDGHDRSHYAPAIAVDKYSCRFIYLFNITDKGPEGH